MRVLMDTLHVLVKWQLFRAFWMVGSGGGAAPVGDGRTDDVVATAGL